MTKLIVRGRKSWFSLPKLKKSVSSTQYFNLNPEEYSQECIKTGVDTWFPEINKWCLQKEMMRNRNHRSKPDQAYRAPLVPVPGRTSMVIIMMVVVMLRMMVMVMVMMVWWWWRWWWWWWWWWWLWWWWWWWCTIGHQQKQDILGWPAFPQQQSPDSKTMLLLVFLFFVEILPFNFCSKCCIISNILGLSLTIFCSKCCIISNILGLSLTIVPDNTGTCFFFFCIPQHGLWTVQWFQLLFWPGCL